MLIPYFFLINRDEMTQVIKTMKPDVKQKKLMKIFCNKSRFMMIVAAWHMVVRLTAYYCDNGPLMIYRIIVSNI